MAKKYDKYELEIILSLGILILFLISVNFISGYSFESAVRGQAIQFENSVNVACGLIKAELEKDLVKWERSETILTERLRDLSVLTGMENIAVTDTAAEVIASLKFSDDTDASDAITVRKPLRRPNGSTAAFVTVSAVNKTAGTYASLSRWDTIFRVAGVISALVVAFLFIRAVLHPYRRIKREALGYNLDFDRIDSGKGIEYIVDTFKDVIDELEEKKSRLEVMYNNSEKRADSLARYNDYILGSISSGVVICDSSGHVTRFNRSAEQILRYFEKDCRGKHYREIFGDRHRLSIMLDDALQKEVTHSRKEFEIKRPDGERLWLGCSSSMINDEKGDGMGAVLLMIDLTEIRRLQELSSYSEKMASLGEMSAGLAHEIRNSFTAVIGFARLVLKRLKSVGDDTGNVDAILNESNKAEELLSRFLKFARPLAFCPEKLDFVTLIETSIDSLVHPQLNRIKITKRLSETMTDFRGDPVLLQQVINNLLLNACDAMPSGGEIFVETGVSQPKSTRAEIWIAISDTGEGIPEDRLDKIFDPFYTDKQDGTGLGLALVKKIVVLHEGRIGVKSKPGKGTRFTVYFPVKAAENQILEGKKTTAINIKSIMESQKSTELAQ